MGAAQIGDRRISTRIFQPTDNIVCVVEARRVNRIVRCDRTCKHEFQPVRTGLMHAYDRTVASAQAQRGVVAEFVPKTVKIKSGCFADRCMLFAMKARES